MTIIKDMQSAFAGVGRYVIGKPFFGMLYITAVLWLMVLLTRNIGMMLIAWIWTIAYLVECMRAVITARREVK